MRMLLFFIIYCSMSFASQPKQIVKNPQSLVCQCLAYIKKQQYQCTDQLCTQVLEPAASFDAAYTSLQKMYTTTIHAPHLFSLSIDGIIFNKKLPLELEENLASHQDLLQYLARNNHAFKSHLRICAAHYKKQIAQNTIPAFENFQALCATLIKPTIRNFFSHEMEQLLAWRQTSLAPRYQKIAEYRNHEIAKLIHTANYAVTVHHSPLPDEASIPITIECDSQTNNSPFRRYISPSMRNLLAHDAQARLFCFRRRNPSQVSVINPFATQEPQEKIVVRPILVFNCAAFSDPTRFLAVGLSNCTIQILYAHNLSPAATIKIPLVPGYIWQQPTALCFFNQGNSLLVGKSKGTVDLYKNYPWQMIMSFDKEERYSQVEQIECSHDDKFAFFHQKGTGFVTIIDLKKEEWTATEIAHQNLQTFALAKTNRLIATAAATQQVNRSETGNIKIWDYETNELLQTLACTNSNTIVSALSFAHDDMELVIGTTAGQVFSWNADQPLKDKLFAAQLEYAIKEGKKKDIQTLLSSPQYQQVSHYQKARIAQLLKQER